MSAKTHLRILQLHVVDHCDYHCNQCTHGAPFAPRKIYAWSDYAPHIEELSRYATIGRWDVMGGEPFLAPVRLRGIVRYLKRCGLRANVHIITNGFWLGRWRAYEAIVRLADCIDMTWHPENTIPYDKAERILKDQVSPETNTKCTIRGPSDFYRLAFVDTPKRRETCIICPQLLTDGQLAKCHLIAYSHFYDHLTTKPFRRLRSEGFYRVRGGDAASLAVWYEGIGKGLHGCCLYCRHHTPDGGIVKH